PGRDLLGAAREFTARQRFQHQGRNQPVTEQRDFFGLRSHSMTSTDRSLRSVLPPSPCKSCVFNLRLMGAPDSARQYDRLERETPASLAGGRGDRQRETYVRRSSRRIPTSEGS